MRAQSAGVCVLYRLACVSHSLIRMIVYGEGYKNAFLREGKEITWFAQPRQWEGTPVVQRLINCTGGEVIDDGGATIELEPTPVLLFCRNEGQGYVYCGELGYEGHDPARIPVRFVWKLLDYDMLRGGSTPFKELVESCNRMLKPPTKK